MCETRRRNAINFQKLGRTQTEELGRVPVSVPKHQRHLQALTKRIDIARRLTKKDAVETMLRAVLERKGTVQPLSARTGEGLE